MTNSPSNCLNFQAPVPLHSLPFRTSSRSITPLTHLVLRCSAQPPQHHNNTTTRRAFLAHLFSTFFLISTPTHGQQQPLDASVNSPPLPPPPTRRPTWGYSTENGPETWAHLSEDWSIAATGMRQSPIPLSYRTAVSSSDTPRPTLTTNPAKFTARVRNLPSAANPSLCLEPYVPPPPPLVGDAPPVDTYTPPPIPALVSLPSLSVTYALRSVHLHVAAEHVFEAAPAPLEIHFTFDKVLRKPPSPPIQTPPASATLNGDADSRDSTTSTISLSSSPLQSVPSVEAAEDLTDTSDSSSPDTPATTLVVAMLATPSGETAPWLSSLLRDFTATAGEDGKGPGIVVDLDMASVLPPFDQSDLYMYTGSLTTPPCTEGVQWLVLSTRLRVKQSDVDAILAIQGGPNTRPLQEVNGRRVIRFPTILPSAEAI